MGGRGAKITSLVILRKHKRVCFLPGFVQGSSIVRYKANGGVIVLLLSAYSKRGSRSSCGTMPSVPLTMAEQVRPWCKD